MISLRQSTHPHCLGPSPGWLGTPGQVQPHPSATTHCTPPFLSTPSYQTRAPHLCTKLSLPSVAPGLSTKTPVPFHYFPASVALTSLKAKSKFLTPVPPEALQPRHASLHTSNSSYSFRYTDRYPYLPAFAQTLLSAFVPNSPSQTPPSSSQHLSILEDSVHGPLFQEAFVGLPRLLLPWAPIAIPTSQSLNLTQ